MKTIKLFGGKEWLYLDLWRKLLNYSRHSLSRIPRDSCILCHRGIQLILAYSWARPAILVAGKGRWGIFLFLLFLHFHSCSFLPCPSHSSLLLSLLSLFSLSLGDDTKWPTRVDVSLNPNTINQSIQGTLWNTLRYPYLDTSDLQNWGKNNSIDHI